MPFRAALSGINVAGNDLKVIGHNVANASTTGFKGSRAEFADVYANAAEGASANAIGSGVRLAAVRQQFGQGNIGFTDNKLDLAINGRGFFILDDNGGRAYSRNGIFSVDREGWVVNSSQQKLVISDTDESGRLTGGVGPLRIDKSNISPQATSKIEVGVNLDSGQDRPLSMPFDPNTPSSFNHSTSLTLYDSLGVEHLSTMYFVKGEQPNTWEVYTTVDGKDVKGGLQPPYSPDYVNFDGAGRLQGINGVPVPPGTINYPDYITDTGSAPMKMALDLMGATPTTQYGGKFDVNALVQNGYTTGRVISVDVDETGYITTRYSNGQSRQLGMVSLADFANPQGLRQLGDTAWAESFASGEVLVGAPGSGTVGLIQPGALEDSNVDLTGELVKMIIAQRNFQASAQVVRTADTVTQTIINIR